MLKKVLASAIILLFIFTSVAPLAIGYNNEIEDKEHPLDIIPNKYNDDCDITTSEKSCLKNIVGEAIKSIGDIPLGANVNVTSDYGSKFTNVSSTGRWKVNILNWKDGMPFNISINLDDDWIGNGNGTVQDPITYVGEIVLYPNGVVAEVGGSYDDYIVGDIVQFYGEAYGGKPPYSYFWDFGDNEYSTLQNPKHSFDESKLYNITLHVADSLGVNDTDTIQIYPPLFSVTAEYQEKRYDVGDSIDFIGNVRGGQSPYQWHWDFGDGETINEQSPQHSYSDPGDYLINLTVIDANGVENCDNLSIQIHPTFKFSIKGSMHIVNFYWNWHDSFPLGFSYLSFGYDTIYFAPILVATIKYSPSEKVAKHTAVNLISGHNLFTNYYYEEFTIIITPCIWYIPFPPPSGDCYFFGRAIAYGS